MLGVYSFSDTSFPFGITVVLSLVATPELGTSDGTAGCGNTRSRPVGKHCKSQPFNTAGVGGHEMILVVKFPVADRGIIDGTLQPSLVCPSPRLVGWKSSK